MPQYVVMFPADNESEWMAGTPADRQATFDTDANFVQRLTARGGATTQVVPRSATAGRRRPCDAGRSPDPCFRMAHSRRLSSSCPASTFVTCEEYEALVEAAAVLLRAHPVVEIRPVDES